MMSADERICVALADTSGLHLKLPIALLMDAIAPGMFCDETIFMVIGTAFDDDRFTAVCVGAAGCQRGQDAGYGHVG